MGPQVAEPEVVLSGSALNRRFGGITAVEDLSFVVRSGSAIGVIGPNGAGKTTLFNLISGFESLDSGTITFRGREIQGLGPHQVSRLGIGRTFQTVRLFVELTVLENLLVADMHGRAPAGNGFEERARGVLRLVEMEPHAGQRAGELSYGQQKLIEMAMVLIAGPSLILFDEPVAGINPALIQKIETLLRQLVERGITLLVVEHNVPFVSRTCESVLVMAGGRLLFEGPASGIQDNERVLQAFLGV